MPFCEQTYLTLPESLYDQQAPQPVRAPEIGYWNDALAQSLGLEPDMELYAGNRLPDSLTPLAQAYAGHQFGHFTMLGDGRAVLLGEAEGDGGGRVDIQLKGSGRTRFSRGGDGRAALEPMLREMLISEAMHALGVPTTRGLAVVTTGEEVMREAPRPGAVLTRVAASHLRVGTFEYASAFADEDALRRLTEYALARHYPRRLEEACPAAALLEGVMDRQAALVAKWMALGFVHGVMNTDNMAISGETIDYGPCAFMDRYHPETVFSSIDRQGRYAYGNQPRIAHWNLAVLAETLLPLIDADAARAEEKARGILESFPGRFRVCWLKEMTSKLGLSDVREGDEHLIGELLDVLCRLRADYTCTFIRLHPRTAVAGLEDWHAKWLKRLENETEIEDRMRRHNPAVIPRNAQVEAALNAAGEGNMSPFLKLMDLLSDPFNLERDYGDLARPPSPDAPAYVTYCGT